MIRYPPSSLHVDCLIFSIELIMKRVEHENGYWMARRKIENARNSSCTWREKNCISFRALRHCEFYNVIIVPRYHRIRRQKRSENFHFTYFSGLEKSKKQRAINFHFQPLTLYYLRKWNRKRTANWRAGAQRRKTQKKQLKNYEKSKEISALFFFLRFSSVSDCLGRVAVVKQKKNSCQSSERKKKTKSEKKVKVAWKKSLKNN